MCLRPLAIGLVFLIAMGRRKFKIGRAHKNYEKKETVGWQKFCWKASQEKTTGILRTVQSQSYYRVVCFFRFRALSRLPHRYLLHFAPFPFPLIGP